MVEPGEALPESALGLPLAVSGGGPDRLDACRGRWLVLYFYPRDSTPGCTTEGRDFDALLPAFEGRDALVLGVSRDSLRSHDRFRASQRFGLPLVADVEGALCEAFDVIREKSMFGRRVLGIERSTFLIDPASRVVATWRGVKVPGHAQAVLDALKAAQAT